MKQNEPKRTAIGFLIENLAGVLFVLGLITVDVSVFLLVGTAFGVLAVGVSLVLLALIISYESANAIERR